MCNVPGPICELKHASSAREDENSTSIRQLSVGEY